jgi:hypothetical protein
MEDVTDAWGFTTPTWSNGAAYADLDNDGDLDLVVHNVEDPPFIYRNKSSGNGKNWLQIKLKGTARNPTGTGAKVWVKAGEDTYFSEISPTHGFYSSVEPIFQVGLGDKEKVDEIRVEWLGNKHQILSQVDGNQRLVIDISQAKQGQLPNEMTSTSQFFEAMPVQDAPSFIHRENDYEDFNSERLLPHRFSNLGPCLSVGDVNGDGMDDFFLGGAKGQAGAIFVQSSNSVFLKTKQMVLESTANFEDTGSLFFDADGDKDLDLYVVSGGNEAAAGDASYQDRLYLNDGNGKFTRNESALPKETSSGKAIVANDFDEDGDLDLFVGGRVVPSGFPSPPESFVLKNDGGKFSNVTEEVIPGFKHIGMVTDLAFDDLDGDQKPELIVAGEWMPITIYNVGASKSDSQSVIPKSSGWWNSLAISDLDGDSDNDIVAGNLGLNTRFRPPMKLFSKDFDANGSLDPIICIQEESRYLPVPMRDNLLKQLPFLKKKFVRNTTYSKASIEQVFSSAELESAQLLTSEILASTWFENKGNGNWEAHPLPDEAQISPVHAIQAGDFNGDGKNDLLVAGNDSGFDVETGPVNTSPGYLLAGDGKGGFKAISPSKSGFWATDEVRNIRQIGMKNRQKKACIIANNNGSLQMLILKKQVK